MQSTKHVIFQLGNEKYGLDIMAVNSIEKYGDVMKVSDAPANMNGIIHLRGEDIPVYSLRRKFALEEKEPDEETKLIIIQSNGIRMAYEVDKMQEITDTESDQINDTPSIVKNKDTAYIKSVANVNGHLIILLDQNGILSSDEQEQIKEVLEQQKES
ncbi:MAG: Chemotaxis protein CheW [Herbinix sp.]|jgi:purine-binding chemotaxis protein CheW|nr:Chemotaxis protein CheW [Herbinix sp.]